MGFTTRRWRKEINGSLPKPQTSFNKKYGNKMKISPAAWTHKAKMTYFRFPKMEYITPTIKKSFTKKRMVLLKMNFADDWSTPIHDAKSVCWKRKIINKPNRHDIPNTHRIKTLCGFNFLFCIDSYPDKPQRKYCHINNGCEKILMCKV